MPLPPLVSSLLLILLVSSLLLILLVLSFFFLLLVFFDLLVLLVLLGLPPLFDLGLLALLPVSLPLVLKITLHHH